tara:strand:+ start:2895 stop:3401 length:507 start_codon:yes stop_codon:yes gene_type:complete
MKIVKHIAVAALIFVISGFIAYNIEANNPVLMTFCFMMIGFLIFNAIIRKSLSSKNYFISKYNLFTSKVWSEKSFDIDKELLFEKIIEVINDSTLKLVDTDKEKLEILAISRMSFKSWGENLYISFETKGSETIMKFCSVTLFQTHSWGKNEKNRDDLLNEIENSLTV